MNSRQTIRTAVVALLLSATLFGAMNVSSQAAVRGGGGNGAGGNGGGSSSGPSGSGGPGSHGSPDVDTDLVIAVPPSRRHSAPIVTAIEPNHGNCFKKRLFDEFGNLIVTRRCDYRADFTE